MPEHEHFMQQAIQLAGQNPAAPFGAVLVDNESNSVVATGINQSRVNPLLHGEIAAINHYASLGHGRWQQLRLYTTAEPCCMCQAAIIWAGIPEVIFGTSVRRLTELGWKQFGISAAEVVQLADFADCRVTGGVLVDQCDALFLQAKR